MSAVYSGLAAVYDRLTAGYDYRAWTECVLSLYRQLRPCDHVPARILDLGCGTGRAALELARLGCAVTGVDKAPEMLTIAADRLAGVSPPPLLLCQDMRRLNLGKSRFDLVIALCDTLNHLLTGRELQETLAAVYEVLAPGGVFVCDLNTEFKLTHVYGNLTHIDEEPGIFLTWENTWQPRRRVCHMRLNLFVQQESLQGSASECWLRYSEHHQERAYSPSEMQDALQQAGFTAVAGPLAAFDLTPPVSDTERVFYAAARPVE